MDQSPHRPPPASSSCPSTATDVTYQNCLCKELMVRQISSITVSRAVAGASQNINTFFESLPQGNEMVLQLFMQQQLQQMLPRESKVACVRESTVRDHLGEGVSCVCASSKLDLAFKNDQCYLPFFIEMKTTVFHALPNDPEEIENFPASVWKYLRQTLVYALSAQAFSHRVRFGNNTPMRCALLFPIMLFMILLSPLENVMKWNLLSTFSTLHS